MPAGCDFICENEQCEAFGSGFVITAPWPLGKIGLVINQGSVKLNTEFRDGLIKLKNEGRKYACITYPNVEDISIEGYRITKWCDTCNRLWQYDVMCKEGVTDLEQLVKDAELPLFCPEDDALLRDFSSVVEDGIQCSFCHKPLKQSRWFSNETSEESK